MEAEFLAIVLVLVYVGAVMVLFLFVVMMLDVNVAQLREGSPATRRSAFSSRVARRRRDRQRRVGASSLGGAGAAAPRASQSADYSNTRALGELLYTKYLYPFELAAVILLVAIVAAIVLTMRQRDGP